MTNFHESDLMRASFEEPFMFDDVVAVEMTSNINNNINCYYTVYGFEKTSEASERDFTQFKILYINQEFNPKIFFSYSEKNVNKSFFLYERKKHQSKISYIYNIKNDKISVMVDPLTCETIPDKTFFEIDVSSENISIIDKLNLLISFDISDKRVFKHLLDKRKFPELYRYFVKNDIELKVRLNKLYPRLLV